MGREIKRVPMDFAFPVGESFADHAYNQHMISCRCKPDPEFPGEEPDHDYSISPPKGDGWQLWQTVSDGPISPVFDTPEELIDFMAAPGERERITPWAQGWPRDVAERFVRGPGWAPSFVMAGGSLMSGVEFVTKDKP